MKLTTKGFFDLVSKKKWVNIVAAIFDLFLIADIIYFVWKNFMR